jgi:hypothetical protein
MKLALPRYRVRLLHLTAIWAYGVTQPMLAIIDGNPDLLLSRDATRTSVALFAVLLAVVPPALAVGYSWLTGRYSRWVGDRIYLFCFGVFLVPLAARLVKHLESGTVLAGTLLGLLALSGVVLYARSHVVRLFVGYSIVLPALSLVWFVHGLPNLSEDAEAAPVRATSPVPIVFIQLDEMAASSLMRRDATIDAVRYPGFARLAREGTWYPNATTVHEWSSDAVPSILSGRIGTASGVPIFENYPDNLFTLLAGSYSLHVHETVTRLCPRSYCPRSQRSPLATGYGLFTDSFRLLVTRVFPGSLSEHVIRTGTDIAFANQGEAERLRRELRAMLDESAAEEDTNVLLYTHLMLPHAPWRFFRSGATYDERHIDGWIPAEYWADEPWLVLQNHQRYLLQVGYVDRQIDRVLRALDDANLYDRALIVVVADHGVSFRSGEGRRPVTPDNLADITNIPLFVKYPFQKLHGVDSRLVRSVDVLPTIADVVGVELPWEVDGVSLLDPVPARDVVVGVRRTNRVQGVFDDARLRAARESGRLHASLAEMVRSRNETLERQVDEFGEGRDSLFRIGTNKQLLGLDTRGVAERSPALEVEVENEGAFDVRRVSGFLPARISCYVRSGRLAEGVELAIAVNGRVRGLTTWFWDAEDEVQRFRFLVPEHSFREGRNIVDVFLIQGRGDSASLTLVGSTRTSSDDAAAMRQG